MKTYLTTLLLLSAIVIVSAQREISALRVAEKITIDGVLDEGSWEQAQVASDFTNWNPVAGAKPSFKSEFKIMYDDDAVYIGAYLMTNSREDISTEMAQRDDIGNTDWVGVVIDTYGNGTEASEFILSATGVQFDAKVTSSNGEDESWNEVWYGATKLTDKGWYAEFKIPYFALRFPNSKEQNWRVNFMRRTAASGEKASYQYLDPEVAGFINQTAILKGVSDIKSPLRLALSPYITSYYQHNKIEGDGSSSYSYNGGLDLKYGINEAFTLDMTLVPDFGQVRSDDRVLNLSPFEVRFSENRAFFTEGLDLFTKADLFYTRRVGGVPVGFWGASDKARENEVMVSNPGETQLYNATKVSGRTKSGLGVGVFNAVAGGTTTTYRNTFTDEIRREETSPLTNYNIVVLDQNLPNNSYVSLINTNVSRAGSEFHSANVTGTEFELRDNKQNWSATGAASVSQLIFDEQDNINGLDYNIGIRKVSGTFNYGISTSGTSRNYNKNDVGYFTRSNIKSYDASMNYSINDGWKSFNRINFWFNTFAQTTYEKNQFSEIHFNTGFWAETKGLWNLNMWTNYNPGSKDFFEPRQEGRFLRRPAFYNIGWWIASDSRKKFRISFNPFFMKFADEGAYVANFGIGPRYRFSDKFSLFFDVNLSNRFNNLGWVDTDDKGEPIIGRRDLQNVQNLVGASYTFNDKMSLTFRMRHDWSKVRYEGDFHGLDYDGNLTDTDYNEFNDFSVEYFNIDLNYVWRFAPGSDIIIVWKNSISGGTSDPLINYNNRSYVDGVKLLSDLPQQNSLSVRLVYFLNAQSLF